MIMKRTTIRSVLCLAVGCFLISVDIAALAQSPPGNLSPRDFDLACAVAAGAEMGASQNEQNIPRRDMALTIFVFYLGRLSGRDDSKDWNAIAWGRVGGVAAGGAFFTNVGSLFELVQFKNKMSAPAPSLLRKFYEEIREVLNASTGVIDVLLYGCEGTADGGRL